MKTRRFIMVVAMSAVVQAVASAAEPISEAGRCKRFEARVIDKRKVEGCPTSFCTTGVIAGSLGLSGTIESAFDSFAPGPATAEDPTRTLSFSLTSTFKMPQGTLTTRESGLTAGGALDPAGRLFAGFGQISGGTGAFAGATGWLQFGGRVTDGLNVTDTMVGEICLPRP